MILIVENDEHVRDVTAVILRSGGYDVGLASNGKEALQIIEDNDSVDLVLTDIRMPVMDGLMLISAMRSHPSMARLPVVAMTGGAPPDGLPPDVCLLRKPFRMHLLLETVRQHQAKQPDGSGVTKRQSSRPPAAMPLPTTLG